MTQNVAFQFFDFEDSPLPAVPELEDAALHVWRRSLAVKPGNLDSALGLLSEDERERAFRYRAASARDAFVLTRSALRILIGHYSGISPQAVRFRLADYGKPLVDVPCDLQFNVSHTDGLALLAFARKRRIGVDVEKMRPQPDALALARRFFSERERRELEQLSSQELRDAFFRCWSRKEAYIKARGEGLSLPLSQFDVAVTAESDRILLATRPDPAEAQRWLLRDVPVPAAYMATVAVSTDEQ